MQQPIHLGSFWTHNNTDFCEECNYLSTKDFLFHLWNCTGSKRKPPKRWLLFERLCERCVWTLAEALAEFCIQKQAGKTLVKHKSHAVTKVFPESFAGCSQNACMISIPLK